MRKIKICLSTTDKLLSKIIRFIQGLPVSHSFIEYESVYYQSTMVYEAKGLNTYIVNLNHVDGRTVYEFEATVSAEQHFNIMKFIHEDAGVPYAWKQLFGFIYIKLCKKIGLKVRNPWPQKGKVCSESCAEILVRFFGVTPDVGYDDMDLVWLINKLHSLPQFKMIKG